MTAPTTPETVRVGVDVGGTFTDLVACDASGRTTSLKVPTTPANPAGGVLDGLAAVGRPAGRFAPPAHGPPPLPNRDLPAQVGPLRPLPPGGFR